MSGHTINIDWFGESLSRQQIAKRYDTPIQTVYAYFRKFKTHVEIKDHLVELSKARELKRPSSAKLYPYKDGRMLTIREIMKLEPHMPEERLKKRYRSFPGDFERIFFDGKLKPIAPPKRNGFKKIKDVKRELKYEVKPDQALNLVEAMIQDAKDNLVSISRKTTKLTHNDRKYFEQSRRFLMNLNGNLEWLLSPISGVDTESCLEELKNFATVGFKDAKAA